MTRAVVVEADGGSRGNPGPAAYGALLRDAETGEVLAEDAARIGTATNNVAEYSGLLAGLRLAAEHAPGAPIEVRMDSKLVVEQMSGRWKIKHPELKSLAHEAIGLAPTGTRYTWVPRAQNVSADRLVNQALDGQRAPSPTSLSPRPPSEQDPSTTLILVRHGVTTHTSGKRFSSGMGGANPGLSEEGRAQVRATAEWLQPLGANVAAVVTSPVRRTVESAEIIGAMLDRPVETEAGFAEMEFGEWDGLTFAEVAERDRAGLDAWLGSLDVAPPGGESFHAVQGRVQAGLDRVLGRYIGRTVVVVSHVTPIKTLVAQALEAPLGSVFRMQLAPASVSVVSFFEPRDGVNAPARSSMRLYNARPPGADALVSAATTW